MSSRLSPAKAWWHIIRGHEVLVGNRKLMDDHGIAVSEMAEDISKMEE